MALNDIVVYPAAATGAAPVAANSAWGEGPAQTLISAITHDYAISGIELQSENNVATGNQDVTIEVEILIYVDGVLKITFPYSMRVDTNVGIYLLDGHDRQWIAEPFVVSAGSTVTVTAKCSSTAFRNWRVKIRGRDLANVRTDTGEVYLTLTPSGTEFHGHTYEDSDTVTLALTPSGTDEYTPGATEYTDSGTADLRFTPSFSEEYTRFDTGEVYLTVRPKTLSDDRRSQARITAYDDLASLKGIHFWMRYDFTRGNGYRVEFYNDSTSGTDDLWGVARIDNGSATYLDSGTLSNYQVGDIVGADFIGDTIELWRIRGGVRTVLATEIDATYKNAGYNYQIIDNTHIDYTDITNVDLSPLELEEAVDSGTIYLTFTPRFAVQHEDSGTVYLTLTPSGTTAADFIEIGTAKQVLTEDFDDTTIWEEYEFNSGGTIASVSGELVASLNPDEFGYLELDTLVPYDLRNSDAILEIVDIPNWTGGGFGYEATVGIANGPDVSIQQYDGVYQLGPGPEGNVVVPSQPTHLRIRLVGEYYHYYYSMDGGSTWIIFNNRTIPEDPSALYVYVYGFASTAGSGDVILDNLVITSESSIVYLALTPSGTDEYLGPSTEDEGEIYLTLTPGVATGSLSYDDEVLLDNPAYYWKLHESSGTTADDVMDNSDGTYINTPTLGQPPLTADGVSSVHLNDAQDEAVQLGGVFPQAGYDAGFSMEIWFAHDPLASGLDQGIFGSWKSSEDGGPLLWLNHVDGSLMGVYGLVGLANYLDSGIVPVEDTVYHVVMTYDDTTDEIKLYVNNELKDTKTSVTDLGGTNNWWIGRYNDDALLSFAGWVERAAIYNEPLSEERIEAHWRAGIAADATAEFVKDVDAYIGFVGDLDIVVPAGGFAEGNLLHLTLFTTNGTTLTGITDDKGNTYEVLEEVEDAGMAARLIVAVSILDTALDPGDEIHIDSDSAGVWVTIGEYSVSGCTFEQSVATGGVFDDDHTSGAITTASPKELLLGSHLWQNNAVSWTPGAGWTDHGEYDPFDYRPIIAQHRIVETAGTYASTGTTPSATTSLNAIVAFVLVPAGPGETAQFVDSGTITLLLTPSGTDDYETSGEQYEDSGTVYLTLTPSGTEYQTREYADSDTIPILFTISGTEEAQFVDSDTTYLTLTASGSDTFQAAESTTVDLRFTPSGTDEYTGVSHYEDTGTITLLLTPDGTEYQTRTLTDAGDVTLALTPSGTDTQTFEFADSGTTTLTFTPSGTDEHVLPTLDAGTATLAFTVSGTELHTQQTVDDGEIYLVLTPSGTEGPSRVFELYSTAYMRWQSSTVEHRLTTYGYLRFDTVARMA